jgi:hypothetical protein
LVTKRGANCSNTSIPTFILPITGAYINLAIDWLFQQMFIYGSYVAVVAGGYIVLYLLWTLRPTPVKVPNKAKKSKVKSSDYLEV